MFYICSMLDSTPDTDTPVPPAASRAEERMRLLRRMSEVGVRMAERLDRQSELCAAYAEGAASPVQFREPNARRLDEIARAFAQVSRAVSVSVALEDRIERGPPLAPPPAERRPPALRLVEPGSALGARREQAASAVRDAIDAHACGDPRLTDDLCRGLDRLLDQELAAVDAFLERPLDETIARLRRDLGLAERDDEAPDAQAEESKARGPRLPLAQPPSRPPRFKAGRLRHVAGSSPMKPRGAGPP
jgi:hypothetical protein